MNKISKIREMLDSGATVELCVYNEKGEYVYLCGNRKKIIEILESPKYIFDELRKLINKHFYESRKP